MKLSKRANQFIFPKGFYDIKEWDDSIEVVYLTPIITEDNLMGYRMTYPDGETHEVSIEYAKELVISPHTTIEAKLSKRQTFIKFALAYQGNLGFEEMMKFYKTAPPELQSVMDALLESDKTQEAVELINYILNTKLEPL